MNELEGLSNMGVWDIVDKGVCYQKTGKPPIRGRWVDVNKGDDKSPVYRSRYVAQELRHRHGGNTRERLFAAMPPLEAFKALISDVATRRGQGRDPRKLLFVDISKAYLHAPVMRNDIYVELPAEMEQPGCCGRLRKALYGTREAARCWEQEYVRMLESIGFRRGSTSPCAFWHKDKGLRLVVHGDDFTSSGTESELRWPVREFGKKYITKVRGIVGPDSHDLRSLTVLNRILEWKSDRITFEADPRHVDMIIKGMGLVNGTGSDVVAVKLSKARVKKNFARRMLSSSGHWRPGASS